MVVLRGELSEGVAVGFVEDLRPEMPVNVSWPDIWGVEVNVGKMSVTNWNVDNLGIGDVRNWWAVPEGEDEFIDRLGRAVEDDIATKREQKDLL